MCNNMTLVRRYADIREVMKLQCKGDDDTEVFIDCFLSIRSQEGQIPHNKKISGNKKKLKTRPKRG